VGFDGTVVIDTPPLPKVVVAKNTVGSNVTVASGTKSVKKSLLIVWLVKVIVTGVKPRLKLTPVGLSTLVNQM
jgi:hypothetical protein